MPVKDFLDSFLVTQDIRYSKKIKRKNWVHVLWCKNERVHSRVNTYVGGLKLTRQNDFSMFGYYINTCTEYKRKAAGLQYLKNQAQVIPWWHTLIFFEKNFKKPPKFQKIVLCRLKLQDFLHFLSNSCQIKKKRNEFNS